MPNNYRWLIHTEKNAFVGMGIVVKDGIEVNNVVTCVLYL